MTWSPRIASTTQSQVQTMLERPWQIWDENSMLDLWA